MGNGIRLKCLREEGLDLEHLEKGQENFYSEEWEERAREVRQNTIENYSHVHDNIVLSYQVDICNKELKMITEYSSASKKEELVTITFTGVSTHRFECVCGTHHNMLNSISQVRVDYFVDQNREMLEDYLRGGAPIVSTSCEELKEYLKESGQKIFKIDAVVGLQGFVFAEEISIEVVNLKD